MDMEQPEESGAKEQPKDGSGIPQRARSAKSRIKKEAPQQGRSAALAVPSNGACASCGSGRPMTPAQHGTYLVARTFSTVRTCGRSVHSTGEAPTWQCPGSAPVPPQGAPGSSGWLGAPRRETGPAGLS